MSHHRYFTVAASGDRLDLVLAHWLGLSRRQTMQLLEQGCVRLNGRLLGSNAKGNRLSRGDKLELEGFERPENQRPLPEHEQHLATISEGPGWIIVNKPAGMGVHPLHPQQRGTLLNAVIARYPHIHGVGEAGLRSGVVHRLDVTTSGALVLALDQQQWHRLREAFKSHAVHKVYQAIVHGRLTGESREILSLAVRRHHPARVAVTDPSHPGARRCSLRWRSIETFDHASHLEIELETGFLHQIRVMLAHLGHPIVGDTNYGQNHTAGERAAPGAERPLLHARSLRFAEIFGQCDVPRDMATALTSLRQCASQQASHCPKTISDNHLR